MIIDDHHLEKRPRDGKRPPKVTEPLLTLVLVDTWRVSRLYCSLPLLPGQTTEGAGLPGNHLSNPCSSSPTEGLGQSVLETWGGLTACLPAHDGGVIG